MLLNNCYMFDLECVIVKISYMFVLSVVNVDDYFVQGSLMAMKSQAVVAQ